MKLAAVILYLAAQAAFSQDLTLTMLGPSTVHEGELIPVRLDFHTAADPTRSRIWTFGGFRVDPPPPECANYSPSCQPMDMWSFRKFDPIHSLGQPGGTAEADINSFVAALKPGTYHIRAVMMAQVLKSRTAESSTYGYPEPRQDLLSKPITVTVIPATAAWMLAKVDAVRKLDERSVKQLGFLYSKEALVVGLELYAKTGQRDFLHGLYRNPDAAQSCEMLRAGVKTPEQTVTGDYVWLLSSVCTRAKYPPSQEILKAKETDPRRVEFFRKTVAYDQELKLETMRVLAARAERSGDSAMTERTEVLRYVAGRNEAVPDFTRPVVAAVIRDLPNYGPRKALSTLSEFWYFLRTENVRPAINAILQKDPFDREWIEARRAALRFLNDLDPVASRAALLAELREFRPTLDEQTTTLLPSVPPMDAALVEHLARSQRGLQRLEASAELLIARYLSANSTERMKRIYESQTSPCQPEMVAYFLRVDPAYAKQLLQFATSGMHQLPGPCTVRYINTIPRLIMTPEIEDYLIAHLQHEVVQIKSDAARMLSGFGTARAKKPLWDSYFYFHEYWKGKEAQLLTPELRDGQVLEEMLRTSIARGRAWFTGDAELGRLGELCISDRCKADSLGDRRYWQAKQLPIEINVYGITIQARVAQYFALESMDAVKTTLSRFPAGTRFDVRVSGFLPQEPRDRMVSEIRQFCLSRGLLID